MDSIVGRLRLLAAASCGIGLAACGGSNEHPVASPTPNVILRGTVSGLTGSPLVLQNGSATQTVSVDGAFSFGAIPQGSAYNVTVAQTALGKICTVSGGSGTATTDVRNVAVTCAADPNAPTYKVSGTVVGLNPAAAGLELLLTTDSGTESVGVAAGGTSFAFTSDLLADFNYAVTVKTAPSVPGVNGAPDTAQNCALSNASGKVVDANITDVQLTCSFSIGGTVTDYNSLTAAGLPAGLQLALSYQGIPLGTVDVPAATWSFTTFSASSPFTFANKQASFAGASYNIAITQQPPGQTCLVANGGVVDLSAPGDLGTAAVYCQDTPPAATNQITGTYQLGTGRDYVTFFPDGTFLVGTHDGPATTGVEQGVYAFNSAFTPNGLTLAIATDTNGVGGVSAFGSAGALVSLINVARDASGFTAEVAAPFDAAPGTPPTPWSFNPATTVASTAGQLTGAWTAANRAFIYFPDGTAFHYAVNGVVNLQDVCLTIADPTAATGTYTQNLDPTTCTAIPGGLAPVNVDASFGFFGLPGEPVFGPASPITYAVSGDALTLTAPGQFGAPPTVTAFTRSLPN